MRGHRRREIPGGDPSTGDSILPAGLRRRFPRAYTDLRVRYHQFKVAMHRFWNDLEEPERGLKRSMIVSVALHLVLLLSFTVYSAWPRPERWESAPLVVSLVTLPTPVPEEPKTPPPDTKESKIKLPEKPKKKQTQPKKPKEQEPKKELPKPKPPPKKQTPPDTLVQAAPEKEPAQVSVQVDEAQFVYDYYLQIVVGKISDAWKPPAGIGERAAETTATLCFRILPQGRVGRVEIEAKSPVAVFDRSACDAVLQAQPFPPFPREYGGRWLTVHLRFAYGE